MNIEIQNQIFWINARGRVFAEDFNVFQRGGIPALEKVADYLEIPIPELKRRTQAGKLRSDDFFDALSIEVDPHED